MGQRPHGYEITDGVLPVGFLGSRTVRESLVPDVVAGLIVSIAFLAGIAIAYRRGFQAALPFRVAELNFLSTGLGLDDTRWMVPAESPHEVAPLQLPRMLTWQQAGSRITGRGEQTDGSVWQMEGVVDGTRVLCLANALRGAAAHPSIWLLRADDLQTMLAGYRIEWNETEPTLSVREISLSRQAVADGSITPEPARLRPAVHEQIPPDATHGR